MSVSIERTDIVIVGAGFTGLSAAHGLRRAGIDFRLLEAQGRVGGRVEAKRNGLGEPIDTGGQFFCDDMPETVALARACGKTFVKTFVTGDGVVQPRPQDAADLYRRVYAIRDRLDALEPDAPEISRLTVADWIAMQPDDADAKAGFLSMIEGLWCRAPEEIPLWYLVANDRRITNEVPELQYFLKETMQSLAADLADGLGSALRLGHAVTRIDHGDGRVVVHTAGGDFAARAAIVAVPPVTARKIAYDPPLPVSLDIALGAWKSGTVVKVLLRYASAFWRERGLSGSVSFLAPHGFYACDASHDDDHPALVAFIGGRLALEWGALGEARLIAAVVAKLTLALGPDASKPLDVLVRDWSDDRWSGGAYSDVVADMGARNAEDILRRGAPPIHFACSELSPSFPGYIEGAIIAGSIAAGEIVAAMEKGRP